MNVHLDAEPAGQVDLVWAQAEDVARLARQLCGHPEDAEDVAAVLNLEFSTAFCGRPPTELDFRLPVDRVTQCRAIACHASQASDNPVLWRRLELLGDTEWLRILNRHGS